MTQPQPNLRAIETKNQQNLKALPNNNKIDYMFAVLAGGGHTDYVLLIGKGHDPAITKRVAAAGPQKGTIDIGKGGLVSAGELTVTGVHGATEQANFKKLIAAFSKKKVIFR
ncbi:MAG: hypothetical protein M3N95_09550 [Actinomycetota bacterium]|nr:hypothetical protein [Actinomycetota bacterium]